MGKEKKTKKGNRDEQADDDGSEVSKTSVDAAVKSKKKGKRVKNDDDWLDEDDQMTTNTIDKKDTDTTTKKKKDKKKSKGASFKDDSDDDISALKIQSIDSDSGNDVPKPLKSKAVQKKKKTRQFRDGDDDIDSDGYSGQQEIKKNQDTNVKTNKTKVLNDESGIVEDFQDDDYGIDKSASVAKKDKKKSRKDRKKKYDDDDDDDLEGLNAEVVESEKVVADSEVGDSKKSKVKEKKLVEDIEEKGVTFVTEISDDEDDKRKKKKKKKKGEEESKPETNEIGDEGLKDEDGESTVKTAAQKKKEKKERERQKKLAQKSLEKSRQKPEAADSEIPVEKVEDNEEEIKGEEEELDDGKKKKDKKKKKEKDKEEKEKDKKRPGKKQILAIQEALKKLKEEEEKARLEEEAKERAAEEAEKLRLEKLRLEQERKERRKQKEKEKRERLKAEGKLLSQAQKQQRARAQAMLEALRARGIDVPKIGEKKERTPRYGERIRNKKVKQVPGETQSKETTPDLSAGSENNEKLELNLNASNEKVPEADVTTPSPVKDIKDSWDQDSDDDVKDAWDISSSEDDEEQKPLKSKNIKKSTEKKSKDDAEQESSEENDSGSDDSESESEDESSSSESDSEEDQRPFSEKVRERALLRIQKRREDNEKNRTLDKLRSPVVCVLGHVDTGKTKILDKIRHTQVQNNEAGGITQQIGATMVPVDAIREQSKMAKNFSNCNIKIPGLLIIDTPGHESFSNLRSRGSSLCDIAILVVDIMHGLEPQTIESINLLKLRKTPFVVALNKVDRLYEWKPNKHKDIQENLKSQNRNTQLEFEERVRNVILQFAEQSLNATLFYENSDPRTFISLVPTSAHTGDGMGNLMSLIVELTQTMMAKQITFCEELQATVLEVKAIPGLGTTIDVILVNGRLREGDVIVLAGTDGPLVTQIRSLLMPQPLKELRVKNPYQEFKEVEGAQGVKVTGKDLDKSIAGLNVLVANHSDEIEICKEDVAKELHAAMSSIKLVERGVFVQASTLGSLEALLEFLRTSKIPYSGVRIGPVVKKDVMKASIMLEHDSQFAVILAFDVKIDRDAQELADSLGVKIFFSDIIYHLFDNFMAYREELKQKKRDQFRHIAVFPCKLRILPQSIFKTRDPIVVGVSVEAGIVKEGTPLCVPSRDFLEVGVVSSIETNHKPIEMARKGQEVCIKIEAPSGEAPRLLGRHFLHTDSIVSKISRQSIDACKEYFRDDLQKSDWQLMVELKKMFQIV